MPEFVPTVCKDPHVYLPSTWRDGRGKLLTDSVIARYLQSGYYGRDKQQLCCRCKGTDRVKETTSSLLFCFKCRQKLRNKGKTIKAKVTHTLDMFL
jgi:ribosomal protein L37AE/L43A